MEVSSKMGLSKFFTPFPFAENIDLARLQELFYRGIFFTRTIANVEPQSGKADGKEWVHFRTGLNEEQYFLWKI